MASYRRSRSEWPTWSTWPGEQTFPSSGCSSPPWPQYHCHLHRLQERSNLPYLLACQPCCYEPDRRDQMDGCCWPHFLLQHLLHRCNVNKKGGKKTKQKQKPEIEKKKLLDLMIWPMCKIVLDCANREADPIRGATARQRNIKGVKRRRVIKKTESDGYPQDR